MYWTPAEIWPDSEVFIIGGGPSIKDLDLSLIKNKRVIGVNDAYKLGDWIDVCFFGDYFWYTGIEAREFDGHRKALADFGGLKVTVSEKPIEDKGILRVRRDTLRGGISKDKNVICWNRNTGIAAINLALLFGCKRIILLGFDMKVDNSGNSNWHINKKNPANPRLYPIFVHYARMVRDAIDLNYPDVEVINANTDSAMEVFTKKKYEELV